MVDVCKRWGGIWLVVGFLGWLGCTATLGQSPGSKPKGTIQLDLSEGETAAVRGTDLVIRLKRARDFTSEGCLGGPVGCPDQVQLEVFQGKEKEEIILYVAHSPFQKRQQVNKVEVFGYRILLTSLKGKQATLNIRAER